MIKLIRTINRNIRDALKSIIRNFSLSLASISCITITLIVVSVSMLLSYNVENFAKVIKKDVTVVIFLDNKIKQERIEEIEEEIYKTDNVAELEFRSKQEAIESVKAENQELESIINEWDEETNPLLDSFLLKVKDIEELKNTANTIKELDGVNTVSYGEDMINQLVVIFKVVEKVCIIMVVALILVTSFLIANTIKLTIFSRKTEIEIMRLVGASNSSIKFPFIIEGLFLGILGAIIPIIITIYGYNSFYGFFNGNVLNSSLAQLIKPYPFVITLSLVLLLIGVLVGMIGSWRAVRKYLKI
ncbi:MAG: permease-like cell division protein FtsX [bacterium]|nr:permease-like cell division protein FtsX [bacterium]